MFNVGFVEKLGGGNVGGRGGGFSSKANLVRHDPTMVFLGVSRRPLSSDCGGGGGGVGIFSVVDARKQ